MPGIARRPEAVMTARTSHNSLPARYCPIPERLIHDVHDSPLAIGLYALIGRLYLVAQAPVPLSRADVARFDPTAKPGAITRAIDRLVARGWLLADTTACKHRYAPTWGAVRGVTVPWAIGQERLGRPRHVRRRALDLTLLDTCMGRLTPHATLAATVTRYLTLPALSLSDVGCYALALVGIPRSTPRLVWLGLIHDGEARPAPSDHAILAICSQRALRLEDGALPETGLTSAGARKLGLGDQHATDQAQPLFFVPHAQIGNVIPFQTGSLIGEAVPERITQNASVSAETATTVSSESDTWDDQESNEVNMIPPQANSKKKFGGGALCRIKQEKRTPNPILETEATQLLRSIGVRPAGLRRHATTPLAQIEAAIAHAKSHHYVNDMAGWVVSLLDDAKYHGHQIALPHNTMPSEWYASGGWDCTTTPLTESNSASSTEQAACARVDSLNTRKAEVSREEEVSDASLTRHVQTELRWRVPDPATKAVIAKLVVRATPTTVIIECAEAAHVEAVERVRPVLRSVLEACGRQQPLRIVVAGRAVGDNGFDQHDLRPRWIAPEVWSALPAMLRVALNGAELTPEGIRAASPTLNAMIHQRYATEIQHLACAVANLMSSNM